MSDFTICITTFLRPEALARCLASVQKYYPSAATDVIDTGGNLSRARNVLVNRCTTPYFVMVEDDMEFTETTKLETLLEIVRSDSELIGCSGGLEETKPRNPWHHDWWEFRGALRAIPSQRGTRVSPAGYAYQPCQLTQNFGIFRTPAVKKFPWDEELPVGEHQSWFYSIRKEWLVGFCRQVTIAHHSDRDHGEYDKYRGRAKHLQRLASVKLGLKLTTPTPIKKTASKPCIIVMGVGHSNTTITTKQIGKLGWNLADADEEYAESESVRAINDRLRGKIQVAHSELKQVLANLPQPWVVKNPKFYDTLSYWLPQFVPYEPVLLWVRKSLNVVSYSYVRRGEEVPDSKLYDRYQRCARHYTNWPWSKLTIEAEDIADAVSIYDLTKMVLIS